jgi:hypothetical protein
MDMGIYIDVEHITDGIYLVWGSLEERYAYTGVRRRYLVEKLGTCEELHVLEPVIQGRASE